MKRISDYTSSGFFAIRTPLLPFETILSLSEGLASLEMLQNENRLSKAYTSDRELIHSRLLHLLSQPEVREALWVGSPDLERSLEWWLQNPEGERSQRLERALYRYIARMAGRPTPFGLFAGCGVGRVCDRTHLELEGKETYRRRSRLDMEFLFNCAETIALDPPLRSDLVFGPNNTLYPVAGRYHYVRSKTDGDRRSYELVSVEQTPYLTATLQRASNGASPLALQCALVEDDPEIHAEEAETYVAELIKSQILISNLSPPVVGPDPLEELISQLDHASARQHRDTLSQIASALRDLDKKGIGNPVRSYYSISELASQLPCPYKLGHLVQVDFVKPAQEACLGTKTIKEILRGVEILWSIKASNSTDPFKQFKQDFEERYQRREVPLVEALDEEVGIGYERSDGPGGEAEPLLEGIRGIGYRGDTSMRWTRYESILFGKWEEALKEGRAEIVLEPRDLESLANPKPLPLPDAFSVQASLSRGPSNNNRIQDYSVYIKSVFGPSGANLMGRFCHADDVLKKDVQAHIEAEEALQRGRNLVFAEIVHLPEGRAGNILHRPRLRQFEIPILANSRAADVDQISLADLLVSVQGDRVILRSSRLSSEIVPRLTTAHNFSLSKNLKIYKFLCDLQLQGVVGGLAWNWGPLEYASILPRVSVGKVVLSRARWRIGRDTLASFAKEHGAARFRAVNSWRIDARIPRFALFPQGDNELVIDFTNSLSVDTFIEEVKHLPVASLVEMFPEPDGLCAQAPEGTFVHDLVIPFVKRGSDQRGKPVSSTTVLAKPSSTSSNRNSRTPRGDRANRSNTATQRTFLVGSEWLFSKLYASHYYVDCLLINLVKPLVDEMKTAGLIKKWFFIRYSDPKWHLRLRFNGSPERILGEVLPALCRASNSELKHGGLWRMQLDTYDREIRRYGGEEGISLSEDLFHADSEMVLQILEETQGKTGMRMRWRVGIYTIDQLLSDFGFKMEEKERLLTFLDKSTERMLDLDHSFRKQASQRFRKERHMLEGVLAAGETPDAVPPHIRAAVRRRSEKLVPIVAELRKRAEDRQLTATVEELTASYIHMHINRLLRSAHRAQEAVLYHFLTVLYRSALARGRASVGSPLGATGLPSEPRHRDP